jgi:hypothetical protein
MLYPYSFIMSKNFVRYHVIGGAISGGLLTAFNPGTLLICAFAGDNDPSAPLIMFGTLSALGFILGGASIGTCALAYRRLTKYNLDYIKSLK